MNIQKEKHGKKQQRREKNKMFFGDKLVFAKIKTSKAAIKAISSLNIKSVKFMFFKIFVKPLNTLLKTMSAEDKSARTTINIGRAMITPMMTFVMALHF